MDMLVASIQIACIAGLLYGLYLSVTFVEPDDMLELRRRSRPRHFAYDPLIADAFGSTQAPPQDRLLTL